MISSVRATSNKWARPKLATADVRLKPWQEEVFIKSDGREDSPDFPETQKIAFLPTIS